jgi:hypothetical protein
MDGSVADYVRTHYSLDLVAFPAHVRARSKHTSFRKKKKKQTKAYVCLPKKAEQVFELYLKGLLGFGLIIFCGKIPRHL